MRELEGNFVNKQISLVHLIVINMTLELLIVQDVEDRESISFMLLTLSINIWCIWFLLTSAIDIWSIGCIFVYFVLSF